MSGSSPEDESGFASLAKLGVKTIVSVDGAKPDVAARDTAWHGVCAFALRVRRRTTRSGVCELAKLTAVRPWAVLRSLPQRSSSWASRRCGDADCATMPVGIRSGRVVASAGRHQPAISWLDSYAAKSYSAEASDELSGVSDEFPAIVADQRFGQCMVADRCTTGVDSRLVKAANWIVPASHPDIDPPHEAVQLSNIIASWRDRKPSRSAARIRFFASA